MLNPNCLKGNDFINKFLDDYEKLEGLGFTRNQALRMLGSLDYVHDFVDTPRFIDFQEKLPKGYKWSDGRKFSYKSKRESETYTFLAIGDDLFIRGIRIPYKIENVVERFGENFRENEEYRAEFDKKWKASKKWATVIRGYKELTSNYVTTELYGQITPFIHNCIVTYWRENGLKCGHIKYVLKDVV